jgi:quercetin 2,3-dioxygenase
MEILELWLNLPAKSKMTAPFYKGITREDIPVQKMDDGQTEVNVISGKIGSTNGSSPLSRLLP